MTDLAFTASTRPAWPTLAESRPARFGAVMALYFMQGVPIGFGTIAVPAWLASRGATPGEIGAFIAFAFMPWSLKIVNGLLMDRFAYRPMGRRRAWIMIAQAAMAAILVAMGIVAPGPDQISLLAGFFFALNLCATFNDVAVDGMVIDLVPEAEHSAINGCMSGSQVIGYAATGYLGGQLLAGGGTATLAFILAVFVALASIIVGTLRERPGERLMPWTSGAASPECEALQQDAWWPIVRGVLRAFGNWRVVVFLASFMLMAMAYGFSDVVSATYAVQKVGWDSAYFSSFASATNLAMGIASIGFTGVAVRLFGMRATVTALMLLAASAWLYAGLSFGDDPSGSGFAMVYVAQIVGLGLGTILFWAWAMHLSDPAVAASQFALFMAIPNFARTLFSGAIGWTVETWGYANSYLLAAAMVGLSLVLLLAAGMGRTKATELAT